MQVIREPCLALLPFTSQTAGPQGLVGANVSRTSFLCAPVKGAHGTGNDDRFLLITCSVHPSHLLAAVGEWGGMGGWRFRVCAAAAGTCSDHAVQYSVVGHGMMQHIAEVPICTKANGHTPQALGPVSSVQVRDPSLPFGPT